MTGEHEDPTRRRPGQSAREEQARAAEQARARPVLRILRRLLDVHDDESAWAKGARGEEVVGRRLERLGDDWVVLHDLPIGARGANVDHVVLGPAGLFSINTKHVSGPVKVGTKVVFVGGHTTDHVHKARAEADRVARLLRPRTGPVEVRPLLVYLCEELQRAASPPLGVGVVDAFWVKRWLRKQPRTLTPQRRAELAVALRDPVTWGGRGASARRSTMPPRPAPPAVGQPPVRRVEPPPPAAPVVPVGPPPTPAVPSGELAFATVWLGAPAGRAVEVIRHARRGNGPLLALMTADGQQLATADVRTGAVRGSDGVADDELDALRAVLAQELRG